VLYPDGRSLEVADLARLPDEGDQPEQLALEAGADSG
jgi:hypothetical protein